MSQRARSDRGRDEGALALLSTPPARRWPDGAIHHGARLAILLGLALIVTLLFPPAPGVQVARFDVGTAAPEDVIASIPFDVPKNRDELERERDGAAASVPPTFVSDPEAVERMETALQTFFERVESAAEEEEPGIALSRVLEARGMPATPTRVSRLQDDDSREAIARAALGAVRELLPAGVLDDAERIQASVGRILVVDPDGTERYVLRDSVRTSREFFEAALERPIPQSETDVDDLVRLTLIHFFAPSLRFDPVATQQDRDAARRAVPTSRVSVLQGEAIVRAHQVVGDAEVERLRAYEEALRGQGGLEDFGPRVLPSIGAFGLNLLLLGIFGAYLFFFRPRIYRNLRWVLLQAAMALAFMGAASIVARQGLPVELLPIAFVALGAAVLWDGRLALVLAISLAAVIGAQIPFQSAGAWLPVFVGGSAAALSVRAVRRRSQTWIFIAIIAAAYVGVIVALGLMTGREPGRIVLSLGWATGNTVVSAILAMGFLPVFEWFTRITTDQTLLEWADPNRPLLKRLSMEAPGTYAHTINVVNLSEAAANAIGANGLLCRVGVYYHDIGKMIKPQYFIENQPSGRNPHDKLKPATSAAIVREHVTEGIRLAREANLPDVLVDFIPEHHGTQDIAFFLDRAQRELAEGETLDPETFRYPGPRPRSAETAIVMLADSVESATRTVQDPTPARIAELIDNIVEGKIRAGQLDEAPLTLRDIGIIKGAFLKVLSSLYHQRVDYPQTRHITGARGDGPAGPEEPGRAAPTGVDPAGQSRRAGDPRPAKDPAREPAPDAGSVRVDGQGHGPEPRRDTTTEPVALPAVKKEPPSAVRRSPAPSEPEPSLFPLGEVEVPDTEPGS
ncbi:MAG: HDIG domain-containing protein [Gemmatimonadales bacterium]|nr:MAG: HDIG domain-containing protein [Gemmatimonadales bacterium]